jgi:hypothetical protein
VIFFSVGKNVKVTYIYKYAFEFSDIFTYKKSVLLNKYQFIDKLKACIPIKYVLFINNEYFVNFLDSYSVRALLQVKRIANM